MNAGSVQRRGAQWVNSTSKLLISRLHPNFTNCCINAFESKGRRAVCPGSRNYPLVRLTQRIRVTIESFLEIRNRLVFRFYKIRFCNFRIER